MTSGKYTFQTNLKDLQLTSVICKYLWLIYEKVRSERLEMIQCIFTMKKDLSFNHSYLCGQF
jgi:hypothetical protein